MTNLPVKAKLITRNGFTKIVYMEKLCNYYRMPLFAKMNVAAKYTTSIEDDTSRIMDFILKSYKEHKVLKYICAVFEEV